MSQSEYKDATSRSADIRRQKKMDVSTQAERANSSFLSLLVLLRLSVALG